MMRGRFATFILLLSVLGSTGAGAMVMRLDPNRRCDVRGSEKLPAHIGGQTAICSEIQRAVASSAPGVPYSADVKVLSKSRLSAALVVRGRALPEQHFAIMDSELNSAAIQRFAASLARAVADATKIAK